MSTRFARRLRLGATAALAAAALLSAPLAAGAGPAHRSAVGQQAPAWGTTTQVPVSYDCYVTYPGGETVVQYGHTFDVTAPDTARRFLPFTVTLDTPPITPNPTLQSDVRDVAVAFRLPADTLLVGYRLTGRRELGGSRPQVTRDGDVLTLSAEGPFPAGSVFDLPALRVTLLPLAEGPAPVTTGGTSFDDPTFSWVRNSLSPGDPPGTLRPFQCQPPADVVFNTTTVAPLS